MRVGMIGLGKLGLPVALAIESKGHEVIGYDTRSAVAGYIANRSVPFQEEGLQPLLDSTKMRVASSIAEVVHNSDLIFLPIQTPHDPKYEGTTRIPEDRRDFDYAFLGAALGEVSAECARIAVKKTIAVISTCLPGTFESKLKPIINEYVDYVYTPQFIAMGTVLQDYLHPEFNLIGVESKEAADQLERFYATINDAPNVRTDVKTAEGIKVSYNTWITAKTVIANAWGELSHRTGMNFDDIKKAWDLSTKRIHSPKYTDSGMSDGGGCHPRDNIAMSWLAKETGMSHNLWEDLMEAREEFEEWHVDLIQEYAKGNAMPIVILGRSFKPETNIEVGSPSVLMSNLLDERDIVHRHVEDLKELIPSVYFIGTKHERYKDYDFPAGSIVIDPFGYIPNHTGVTIIRVGRTQD